MHHNGHYCPNTAEPTQPPSSNAPCETGRHHLCRTRFPCLPTTQQPPPTETTATLANNPAPIQQPPFDYQATLDCITKDIEMTLKAKFDAAIANLQQSFMNLECRVDQKLQMHMDNMKALQADKSTQDDHTQCLEQVTKTLDTLVAQMHVLLDSRLSPMPQNGIGLL